MTPLVQFLFMIALAVAPPGTEEITISAASETYHLSLDDNGNTYSCSQLQPFGRIRPNIATEHPIITNQVIPDGYTTDAETTAQISSHNWNFDHVLKFDDDHQLEKEPGGYVYAVHIGSPSQKIYSITFSPCSPEAMSPPPADDTAPHQSQPNDVTQP